MKVTNDDVPQKVDQYLTLEETNKTKKAAAAK